MRRSVAPALRTQDARVETVFALAGGDRDRARVFVERELGPLLSALPSLGPRADRLLHTLEVYLDHGQRIANVSAVTGAHRDTVHRHLRAVEQLLDCRVEERSAELLWALRLRRSICPPEST